jgi:hypothetical protein
VTDRNKKEEMIKDKGTYIRTKTKREDSVKAQTDKRTKQWVNNKIQTDRKTDINKTSEIHKPTDGQKQKG